MTEAVVEQESTSYLEMSDEDIIKNGAPKFDEVPEKEEETVNEVASEPEEAASTSEETEDADDSEEAVGDKPNADDAVDAADVESKAEVIKESKTEVKADAKPTEKDTETKQEVDYKAVYEKILAPFKANGREIAVSNVDDAIALMQMGANYNKKMEALKPNLKLLKMLEKNNMLNEERISFLIDLEKKNPEAINKLVKDSGIDPLDLNAEKAGGYQPKSYTVDDKEMELDAVLEELQATPTYSRTLDVVSNKWDGTSKRVIADTPQILKIINTHMETGVYDLIHAEMERERMFGRLSGLSDIDAYKQVGDSIQARGGFNHLISSGNQTQPKPVVVQPKPKVQDESKLKDKRLAASTSKPAGSNNSAKDYNPLSMSDDEFSKLLGKKLF